MGVFPLRDAMSQGLDITSHFNWISAMDFSLEGGMEDEWNVYIGILKSNFMSIGG